MASKGRLLRILAVAALVVLSLPFWLVPVVDLVSHEDAPMIDLRTVKLSTWKANEYLAAPEGFTPLARPHATAPVYPRSADEVARRLKAVVMAERRIEWREEAADGLKFEVIQRSKLIGFPDTVTVEVLPLEGGGSTLAIYSRSRYGRADFGVNGRRVESWLQRLEATLK